MLTTEALANNRKPLTTPAQKAEKGKGTGLTDPTQKKNVNERRDEHRECLSATASSVTAFHAVWQGLPKSIRGKAPHTRKEEATDRTRTGTECNQ